MYDVRHSERGSAISDCLVSVTSRTRWWWRSPHPHDNGRTANTVWRNTGRTDRSVGSVHCRSSSLISSNVSDNLDIFVSQSSSSRSGKSNVCFSSRQMSFHIFSCVVKPASSGLALLFLSLFALFCRCCFSSLLDVSTLVLINGKQIMLYFSTVELVLPLFRLQNQLIMYVMKRELHQVYCSDAGWKVGGDYPGSRLTETFSISRYSELREWYSQPDLPTTPTKSTSRLASHERCSILSDPCYIRIINLHCQITTKITTTLSCCLTVSAITSKIRSPLSDVTAIVSVETSNFFFYLSKSKSSCSQNYLSKSKSTL